MSRLTSLVLLGGGAVLLVTWLVSPASSAPQAQPPGNVVTETIVPELDDINREVDRLGERLRAPVEKVAPVRDPFQFSVHADGPAAYDAPVTAAVPLPPIAPAVIWPRLVAILTPDEASADPRRAVFEDSSRGIRIVTEGESIDGFVIGAISPRDVIVSLRDGGSSTRVSLR